MSVLHGFEQTRQRRIDELDAALHEYKRISFLFFSSYHIPTASATENTGLPAAVMPSKQ